MADAHDLALKWSGRVSLTPRILAVNIFALALLAGSLFYLDGYRSRLIGERIERAERETQLVASALAVAPVAKRDALVDIYGRLTDARLRLYDPSGRLIRDSWQTQQTGFDLRDTDYPQWQLVAARWLDIGVDFIVGAVVPRPFIGFDSSAVVAGDRARLSLAADRTHVITAKARVAGPAGLTLVSDRNARDIRQIVRAERGRLGLAIGVATALSVFLSLFLARTIVRPLRMLARAAVRVRLGRSREVIIPRLPTRRDEIGMLARAISDMSHALRQRIDSTETFAADVAHELKNPLASLRSAIESLQSVRDPELQTQLLGIASDDVRRLDRLISDISELSRIDARLSRTRFESVDLTALTRQIVDQRNHRTIDAPARIRLSAEPVLIRGDAGQLARVIENLVDNAMSFAPVGSTIAVALSRDHDAATLTIDDDGPGIPDDLREAVFERFHSARPDGEVFGQHSGLGLAIARTIINGHGGKIAAMPKPDGSSGARLSVTLPAGQDG